MNYEESLVYLNSFYKAGIKLGNERFLELLSLIGNPHFDYDVIHVTGTKGKGSTTAMAASILEKSGRLTGGYFSPYVFDVRERVAINGEMISQSDFADLATELKPICDSIAKTSYGEVTEFEFKTALAFLQFSRRKVDCAVIEVGIGGRLDATNVVAPISTVITNVGLDHVHILGDTEEKIAFEKAGIIKMGIPCITAVDHLGALNVIKRRAQEVGSPLIRVSEGVEDPDESHIYWHNENNDFSIGTKMGMFHGLKCGLPGRYQIINAACATGAVAPFLKNHNITEIDSFVRAGLASVHLPGRLETICNSPLVILDGAHNGIAAQSLLPEIVKRKTGKLFLIIGMSEGHDPDEFLRVFAKSTDKVLCTEAKWHRRLPAQALYDNAKNIGMNATIVSDPTDAVKNAMAEASPEDIVLVTGSFYVIGDVDRAKLSTS